MQWGSSYITVPLKRSKSCPNLDIGTLTLAVRVLSFLEVAQLSLYSAENSVSEFIHNSKKLSSTQAERQRAGYETLKPICAILDIVGPLVMFSPEPICAAVIGIIRSATKSVLEQIEQDADVLALIKQIEHIYFLVAGTAGLKSQRTDIVLKDALRELVIVLEDCTQFLVTFCKSSFLGRLARTPQQARQLKVLQARVANTAAVLNRALLLKTALSTEKVARDLDKYEANMMLERLGNVVMSTDARPRCTDGAHATILASVKAWATAPLQPGKNIFWLRGPESHDKRAVVTTLFEEFLTTRHLGGNFFFEEDRRRNPALVMQTLAWQLTCYHAPLRFDIAHRIKENKSVLEGRLEDQFEELLLQPLLYHSPDRPVVFMLDGLEWCGKERGKGMGKEDFLDGLQWRGIGERKESEDISASVERAMLEKVLRVLVEGSACFPPNARLLISSGEYETVLELLGDCNRVVELEMEGDDTVTEPVVDWRRRSF
ncbi:hypothetical protein B0H19DRAFT_15809 [Mycena capillaripes]|nr:hypothetical protein B0H19DRAFT_15809 [Mycena capillaripes]